MSSYTNTRISKSLDVKALTNGDTKDHPRKQLRIGLISPYTGGNLGDAAIIESARKHLVRLYPDAEFLLIVIDCERVSELHHADSFPLAGIPRHFYFMPRQARMANIAIGHSCQDGAKSLWLKARFLFKNVAEKIPMVLPAVRRIRNFFLYSMFEVDHLLKARRVVRNLDALIIAGGGQFDDEYGGPWGHPYSIFKWVKLARRRGVPVFFVGAGVDDLRHSLSCRFLRSALSAAHSISLRDAGSVEILRSMGIQRELVSCTDLAFGLLPLDEASESIRVKTESSPTIGLSPIAFGRIGSWPTIGTELFERYWREFEKLAESLLDHNYALSLFVTDAADYPLVRMLYNRLLAAGASRDRLRLLRLERLSTLLSAMKEFDAVIASRLHGVLLSHVSGIPVLAISYRRKVRIHMADMEQERFCLNFETFTALGAQQALENILKEHDKIGSALRYKCAGKYKIVEWEFNAIGATLCKNQVADT
jgi:polysaccharide pyruvyl transferase WcaK-like protein